jgi:predicted kinase
MTKMILIRGLPGSGKSTLAEKLEAAGEGTHLEADMFFTDHTNQNYKFDASKLSLAHDWCYGCAAMCLQMNETPIISNTFTKVWEMEKYFALAQQFNVPVEVHVMKGNYGSVHGVPEEKLKQMANRWEEIPAEWSCKEIFHG